MAFLNNLKVLKKFLIIIEQANPPRDLELAFSFEPLQLSLMGFHQSIRANQKTIHLGLLVSNFLKTKTTTQKTIFLSLHIIVFMVRISKSFMYMHLQNVCISRIKL